MIYWSLSHTIRSDVPLRLPRARDASGAFDIDVRRTGATRPIRTRTCVLSSPDGIGEIDLLEFEDDDDGRAAKGIEFRYPPHVVQFHHTPNSRRIEYTAGDVTGPDDLATVIEGPVLGWFLRQRGEALLHAAAVVWNDRLLAITALPGVGKSTLSGLLQREGAEMWSDDILRFEPESTIAAADGRPQRLSRESRALRGTFRDADVPIHSLSTKVFATEVAPLTEALRQPRPIDHILVLVDRIDAATPTFEPLAGLPAQAAILSGRYPSWLRPRELEAAAFEAAGRLAARVPVTLGRMPHGLDRLNAAVPNILAWLDTAVGAPGAHH